MKAKEEEKQDLSKGKKILSSGGKLFSKGFGKLNSKLKAAMKSTETKFNEEAQKHSNLIFYELSRFV